MEIHAYAATLLLFRLSSMVLMGRVVLRQLELFKMPVDDDIKYFRVLLFVLSISILIGNFIPAIIDILTIADKLERSTSHVNGVSLVYTFATSLSFLLGSYLIYKLYDASQKADDTHDDSDHTVLNDKGK